MKLILISFFLILGLQSFSQQVSVLPGFSICGNVYNFNITDTINILSWEWDLGDGTILTNNEISGYSFEHYYSIEEITYSSLTIILTNSDSLNFINTILPNDQGSQAKFNSNVLNFNSGDIVTFNDQSICFDGNIIQWNWYFGDGNSSIQNSNQSVNHQYFISDETNVMLVIMDDHGCTDDYVLILNNQNTLAEINSTKQLFFPNPTNDFVFFNIENDTEIEIVNLYGTVIFKTLIQAKNNKLNLSNFYSGIYFIKSDNNITKIQKL